MSSPYASIRRWLPAIALLLANLLLLGLPARKTVTAQAPSPTPQVSSPPLTPTFLPYPSTAYPVPAYIPPRIATPAPVQVRPLPAAYPGGPVARLFSQVLPDVLRAILSFALIGGGIVACGVALYVVIILMSASGRWLRDAWAAATRTTPRKAALGAGFVLIAGLAVRTAIYQPLVPLPADTPLAVELRDTYLGAEVATLRIRYDGEPVTLLAHYYADAPGYRQLTSQERAWIVEAFGPQRLEGAGMLTSHQANLIAVFGALPAPGVPNPLGRPLVGPPGGYPEDAGSVPRPVAYWVNLRGDRAAIRVLGCGRGDYHFHKYADGWRIVHFRVLEPCRG